jgi:adenine specific DNA methylase Mod
VAVRLEWDGRPARVDPPPAALRALEPADADDANLLVHGDNLLAASALLPGHAGAVQLIYIDPPFATGADFAAAGGLAYRDRWGPGLDDYLTMMYERLTVFRELLAPEGSIFVHADRRAGHLLRLLLDEIFGAGCFRNELVWSYRRWTARPGAFQHMHDVILYSARDPARVRFNLVEQEARAELRERKRRGWNSNTIRTPAGRIRQLLVYDRAAFDTAVAEGRVRPAEWDRVVDATRTTVAPGDVLEIPILNPTARERVGYPTQKPEALLERIVEVATDPGDLVADLFAGSGTTLAVAERMGRRWIGCDAGDLAIETIRTRLRALPGCRPFDVASVEAVEAAVR